MLIGKQKNLWRFDKMVSRNTVSTESKGMRTSQKSVPKTFKAIIRETTVYKYIVELKEDALTEKGFFDLVNVPGLYVSGAGQFLRNIRKKHCLTQKEMAKSLNFSRSQWMHWEANRHRIPIQSLVKSAEASDISRDTIYSLIDQGKLSTKTNLPVKLEEIRDIIQHFSPRKCGEAHITLIGCSKETLSKIKTTLNTKLLFDGQKKLIYSQSLYNFLTTFFHYTEVPKIQPPLTNEVKRWYDQGVDLKRAIIIPCLQSDGNTTRSHQRTIILFSGNSESLHQYFVDAMYYEYNELPSTYFRLAPTDDCHRTLYARETATEIVNEIMKLAGSTKTSPGKGQTIGEYLKEPQPHLNYLINAPETEQKIALRIWASTEGSIGIRRKGSNDSSIYPDFLISCSHPNLITQLQQISLGLNIKLKQKRTKQNWSRIQGLHSGSLSSCTMFLKHGGFIQGVSISAHSKYHKGIDKDILLLGILEFKLRQKTNEYLRKLPLQQIHYELNKIIKNSEYKSVDYYINHFS